MANDGPVIVDFMVDPEENVYPMIPPGESVKELVEEPDELGAVPKMKPGILPPS